eukprot:TRINITY_DN5078_c0_g1_i1.p1 TRINITY_DN5078_c0_g1~~TRINITY_DN5078_c0_g1_i1.p1  ORF type:complete len:200 (-),score=23.69 TRINITY_DN5078_c0_g1_i1:102-701(-)
MMEPSNTGNDEYHDGSPLEQEANERQEPLNCLIAAQASIQTYLRPGMWAIGCRYPHAYCETWSVTATSVPDWITVLKKACYTADRAELNHGTGKRMIWHKSSVSADQVGFARIKCFTRAGWLDLLEFEIRQSNFEPGRLNVKVHGFSTGYWPLSIPCAVLLNIGCCFCPFGDHNFPALWMASIRDSGAAAIVVDSKRFI